MLFILTGIEAPSFQYKVAKWLNRRDMLNIQRGEMAAVEEVLAVRCKRALDVGVPDRHAVRRSYRDR